MPVQPAPAVRRAAQVLAYLGAKPQTDRSLTDVARAVGIHRASCQTLLLALVAEGFVVRRTPSGRYRLGPVLIGLGHAARAALSLTDLLDAALEDLGNALGVTAFAAAASGGSVVVLASRPAPHPYGQTVATGARLALRAPIGLVYVAWADDADFDSWLDTARPPLHPIQRSALVRDRDLVRNRGWSATTQVDVGEGAAGSRELRDDEVVRGGRWLLGMSAPVWESPGVLACSLALTGFPSALDGAGLASAATLLTRAAASLSLATETSGVDPGGPAHHQPPNVVDGLQAGDHNRTGEADR